MPKSERICNQPSDGVLRHPVPQFQRGGKPLVSKMLVTKSHMGHSEEIFIDRAVIRRPERCRRNEQTSGAKRETTTIVSYGRPFWKSKRTYFRWKEKEGRYKR